MSGRNGWTLLWVGLLTLFVSTLFAQERWVYRLDGSRDRLCSARSIVVGLDSNLYASGRSYGGPGTWANFTVLSLTDSGTERWVYRYNPPGGDWGEAYSITVGSDGNLYASGRSYGGPGTSDDFTVVSLTASGTERWVYRYNGPGNLHDWAYSIVMGSDGNLYAAGFSEQIGTARDFTVVSLTHSGTERWVYHHNGGSGNFGDWAHSIIMGPDGNLYAAGTSVESVTSEDFTVISLTDSGVERWVYHYDGPGFGEDCARSIAAGPDGNLYATGYTEGTGTSGDLTVISLTDSGTERWVYRYNGPGSGSDEAYSITVGSDGNLYASGRSYGGTGTSGDFTVVSLTASGTERWVYRYSGPGFGWDCAYSIVMGSDGNLYAAGDSRDMPVRATDFTVVSLTASGAERWVYHYDGPGFAEDYARSIAAGPDGSVYGAGASSGTEMTCDLTVVCLDPHVGADEGSKRPRIPDFCLRQNRPNPFHRSTIVSYSLPATTQVTLSIYDITGRLVETLVNEAQQPGIHQVRWNREFNPSGVYFYLLRAGESVSTKKMVVVE